MAAADTAMYRAKHDGRDRLAVFEPAPAMERRTARSWMRAGRPDGAGRPERRLGSEYPGGEMRTGGKDAAIWREDAAIWEIVAGEPVVALPTRGRGGEDASPPALG